MKQHEITYQHRRGGQTALRRLFETRVLQLLLAGMYFLIRVSSRQVETVSSALAPARPVSRSRRLQLTRKARLSRNTYRNSAYLRNFMPKGLTGTQYLERQTKLSHMGRFQIYNWLYYRWEFWRIGAIVQRCRSTCPATSIITGLASCGLSAAHLGPD